MMDGPVPLRRSLAEWDADTYDERRAAMIEMEAIFPNGPAQRCEPVVGECELAAKTPTKRNARDNAQRKARRAKTGKR